MLEEIKHKYEEIYSPARRRVISFLGKATLAGVALLGIYHIGGNAIDYELDRNEKIGELYNDVKHPDQRVEDPVGGFSEESGNPSGARSLSEQSEDSQP